MVLYLPIYICKCVEKGLKTTRPIRTEIVTERRKEHWDQGERDELSSIFFKLESICFYLCN